MPSSLLAGQSTTQNGGAKTDGINHDPPQELLPNRRPNTEDFLTFLCFRGTSVLPSHLDFFNTNKNSEPKPAKPKTEITAPSCSSKDVKQEDKRSEIKHEKCDNVKDAKKDNDPPKFIPFAVRKRADTVAAGSRKQTVQALKKKYQDQRIAKNKAQCKTRSSTAKEVELNKMQKPKQNDVDVTSSDCPGRSRNKRKLRGTVEPEDDSILVKAQKTVKEVKDACARSQKTTFTDTNKVRIFSSIIKSI